MQPIFTNSLGGHSRKISVLYNVFPSIKEALEKEEEDVFGTDVSTEAFLWGCSGCISV